MSKQQNGTMNLKPLYIILVPVIAVILILNSGYLQKWLPCVTVNGTSYNVVRYDYYYFSAYNDFVEENSDNLEALGFDSNTSVKTQQYNDDMTWMDYFCQQGEQRMMEAAYYNDLASAASYEFTEEELAPVTEKMDEITELCTSNGVTISNYMTASYGSGMTEAAFKEELTYEVQGEAYKSYLEKNYEPEADAITAWISQQKDLDSYTTADLQIIELDASIDRFSEEVGDTQLLALQNKLDELTQRYVNKTESFEQLSTEFSVDEDLVKTGGTVNNCTKDQLTDEIADWCFNQERTSGDYLESMDKENGKAYLVVYVKAGDSSQSIEARDALAKEAVESAYEDASYQYTPVTHKIGMTLIGR